MKPKFYMVGGYVRDMLMGIKSKDIDFTVECDSYQAMRAAIVERCGSEDAIKVEKPEFLTIRAVDPKLGGVDFVMARKDGAYSDGRRPDEVVPGTLLDDLARRDFTVNAMAIDEETGDLIDPFWGKNDLKIKLLRCVGNTSERMAEDSLRILRALRFCITKEFYFDTTLQDFLYDINNTQLLRAVSIERVREELFKCFSFNTMKTLYMLERFPHIRSEIFSRNIRLTPTVFAL